MPVTAPRRAREIEGVAVGGRARVDVVDRPRDADVVNAAAREDVAGHVAADGERGDAEAGLANARQADGRAILGQVGDDVAVDDAVDVGRGFLGQRNADQFVDGDLVVRRVSAVGPVEEKGDEGLVRGLEERVRLVEAGGVVEDEQLVAGREAGGAVNRTVARQFDGVEVGGSGCTEVGRRGDESEMARRGGRSRTSRSFRWSKKAVLLARAIRPVGAIRASSGSTSRRPPAGGGSEDMALT